MSYGYAGPPSSAGPMFPRPGTVSTRVYAVGAVPALPASLRMVQRSVNPHRDGLPPYSIVITFGAFAISHPKYGAGDSVYRVEQRRFWLSRTRLEGYNIHWTRRSRIDLGFKSYFGKIMVKLARWYNLSLVSRD